MSGETSLPFGRTQAVLAVCVQVVTLTGAICFLIGVGLISTVFGAWGVNFLQVASTGDVINSGLDIVARMALPVLLVFLAAFAGWTRPPASRTRAPDPTRSRASSSTCFHGRETSAPRV